MGHPLQQLRQLLLCLGYLTSACCSQRLQLVRIVFGLGLISRLACLCTNIHHCHRPVLPAVSLQNRTLTLLHVTACQPFSTIARLVTICWTLCYRYLLRTRRFETNNKTCCMQSGELHGAVAVCAQPHWWVSKSASGAGSTSAVACRPLHSGQADGA